MISSFLMLFIDSIYQNRLYRLVSQASVDLSSQAVEQWRYLAPACLIHYWVCMISY